MAKLDTEFMTKTAVKLYSGFPRATYSHRPYLREYGIRGRGEGGHKSHDLCLVQAHIEEWAELSVKTHVLGGD